MTGPTFILSIWKLVDGALGTQNSIGAAANTVGPISKMGTLGTSIRALGGREKGSGRMGLQGQFHTSEQGPTQLFKILHPQTLALYGLPVLALRFGHITPYYSLDPPVLPHPLSLTEPGATTIPSHCMWQCPPWVGIPGGRRSIHHHGQTREAPCSGAQRERGHFQVLTFMS